MQYLTPLNINFANFGTDFVNFVTTIVNFVTTIVNFATHAPLLCQSFTNYLYLCASEPKYDQRDEEYPITDDSRSGDDSLRQQDEDQCAGYRLYHCL